MPFLIYQLTTINKNPIMMSLLFVFFYSFEDAHWDSMFSFNMLPFTQSAVSTECRHILFRWDGLISFSSLSSVTTHGSACSTGSQFASLKSGRERKRKLKTKPNTFLDYVCYLFLKNPFSNDVQSYPRYVWISATNIPFHPTASFYGVFAFWRHTICADFTFFKINFLNNHRAEKKILFTFSQIFDA